MPGQKILVGTSGWTFHDWARVFYPRNLSEAPLAYYSRRLKTVEVNSSFYHLPAAETFSQWRQASQKDFLFSVKLGRYITHRKKLILDPDSRPYLDLFFKNSQELKEKFAAVLVQLPPSFSKNSERLEKFLEYFGKASKKLKPMPRTAVEFRHESWFSPDIYKILKKNKVGLVISSTPEFRRKVFTADFTYIRMHGSEKHDTNYQERDLKNLKREIGGYPGSVKYVFVYFNNDYSAFSVGNAERLASLFEHKCSGICNS